MTEENKKANIQEELQRANQARESAQILFQSGHLADAVSRLYYWVFHTVLALLLSKGLQPKTQEGCLTLFSLHFVKKGPFVPAHAHILSRLMKYRQEADYNRAYRFTKSDFLEFRKDGETLCSLILRSLKEQGYT